MEDKQHSLTLGCNFPLLALLILDGVCFSQTIRGPDVKADAPQIVLRNMQRGTSINHA